MRIRHFFMTFFAGLLFSSAAGASTLVLEGGIEDSIDVTQERVFAVPPEGLKKLTFRFANPTSFKSPILEQAYGRHALNFEPKPDSVKTEKDRFGNTYTVVTWTELKKDAVVKEAYSVSLSIKLKDIKSGAPFPLELKDIPASEKAFLEKTAQTDVDAKEVRELAMALSKDAKTEQAAVMAVLNWVVDNIKYKTPIPEYGALWTLKSGYGNCQNYAHLSIAMLRSIGIPARIVGGITIGRPWKVPLESGALTQSIGQGGHAWMEVWYPDLGWVPYDPQQSHLFVSPRHIKQTVGLDSVDVNDSWRAAPILPPFREAIAAEFLKDEIKLSLRETLKSPQNYIMTASFAPVAPMKKIEEPVPVIEEPVGKTIEFGNMEFPSLMDFYMKTKADVGYKTFDKETAEYVTGDETFAQAFTVKNPMKLETVSLAMHKFGGRLGSLWIDIVTDDNGKPGNDGVRSMPLSLDSVTYAPGYKWFDFIFSRAEDDRPVLKPGKYWIILRKSKDAVVNWFYTPGNATGSPDDARTTGKGIDWPNILNLDFNFKVRGVITRE